MLLGDLGTNLRETLLNSEASCSLATVLWTALTSGPGIVSYTLEKRTQIQCYIPRLLEEQLVGSWSLDSVWCTDRRKRATPLVLHYHFEPMLDTNPSSGIYP